MLGAKTYRYQLSTKEDFSTTVVDEKKASTSDVLTTALPFGTYYWRAQAIDAAGNESGWSSVFSFDETILKTPLKNSTSTVNKPVFTWQAVTGAMQYRLEFWPDEEGASTETFMFIAPTASYTFTGTLPNGTYNWHMCVVPASGSCSDSDWTPTWQFTVNH
jgi:hypothetical protein